jgi:glucose 1-dehydrogenase
MSAEENVGPDPNDRRATIVTGAGSGIGRAVAMRLATERCELALIDIDAEGLEATAAMIWDLGITEGVRTYALDVTDAESVEAAVADFASATGGISALVSNAGVLAVTPVLDLSLEQWRRTIEVNLTGSFICTQAVARAMVAAGAGGRIVTIASVHSVAPGTNVADYDASKGGLLMLTRSLARELAPHGITVNAIGPGLISTNLGGGTSEDYLGYIVPTIPLKRVGKPSDVAGAVSFLIGPDADYITGTLLIVDGGMLLTADL